MEYKGIEIQTGNIGNGYKVGFYANFDGERVESETYEGLKAKLDEADSVNSGKGISLPVLSRATVHHYGRRPRGQPGNGEILSFDVKGITPGRGELKGRNRYASHEVYPDHSVVRSLLIRQDELRASLKVAERDLYKLRLKQNYRHDGMGNEQTLTDQVKALVADHRAKMLAAGEMG